MGKVIPKCKDCDYHSYDTTDHGRFGWSGDCQKYNWCSLNEIKADGNIIGSHKFITAAQAKTSPKWCPKREKVTSQNEYYLS